MAVEDGAPAAPGTAGPPSHPPPPVATTTTATAIHPPTLLRKLYARTVPLAVTLTLVTFIDRSNVALAAPSLIHDLGLTHAQFGLASGVLMISYGLFMLPSALGFTLLGMRAWFAFIVFAWGIATAATGAVRSAGGLYAARLVLGAAEAGCMPGCWFLLSSFLPASELPRAYSFVIAATVVSQVVGGPLAAVFLGPADGVGGLAGWRWLFIVEGCATAAFGAALHWMLADSPEAAPWLSADEAAWVRARHEEDEAAAAEAKARAALHGRGQRVTTPSPAPADPDAAALSASRRGPDAPSKVLADALLVVRRWQMWLLGACLALVQLAYFAVMFFTPLLIGTAFGTGGGGAPGPGAPASERAAHTAVTALKSTAVYGPAAVAVIGAGALSRRTGDRRWTCVSTLAVSAAAFGALPTVSASSSGGGLALLALAAAGGVASLSVLTTWPGDYALGDPHAAASYSFFNAFAAVGGFVGPYLMGALRFPAACAVMAGCQALAAGVLFVFGTWEARGGGQTKKMDVSGGEDGEDDGVRSPSGRLPGPAHSLPLVA
jgi:MFS transporter, ACS family, tartrate transporter